MKAHRDRWWHLKSCGLTSKTSLNWKHAPQHFVMQMATANAMFVSVLIIAYGLHIVVDFLTAEEFPYPMVATVVGFEWLIFFADAFLYGIYFGRTLKRHLIVFWTTDVTV
jgi:hypothetical protein